MARHVLAAALLLLLTQPARAEDATIETKQGTLRVQQLAEGLNHPWGMAFLPDGRMLVTERSGSLRIVGQDGTLSEPLKGVPAVVAAGQGGLLDVTLDPKFAENKVVYIAYSEAGDGGTAGTAVARATLGDGGLDKLQVIFRQEPKVEGGNHFGGRLAFAPDGTLFVALGERFTFEPAQDLGTHLGKIVRINPDGSVPPDNPFVGQEGALPEIWSYGHRNPQGLAINPESG
jgi:glucose/arabinose dehydrogenase